MNGTYDFGLVVLSIGVAVIASYVALDLAARVVASRGSKAALYWFNGGAIAMGTGIWSMHFIGMLAFQLPIAESYDIPITLLSLLIAMVVSGFALHTVSRDILGIRRLLTAGLCMGIGIAAMHYTGMAAMQMLPAITYDPLLFVLSVLIAIVAAIAALWIAFQLRSETIASAFWKRTCSALIMGAAISGMHYTGMAAAIFAPNSFCTVDPQGINDVWLASTIGGFTFMFLMATLLISVFDARLADRSAKLAETLRKANVDLAMRTTELTRVNEVLRQEGLERMQAETALRQSDERLRAAFDQSAVGIAHTELDGKILQVNTKLCDILGYTREELLQLTSLDITLPEERSVAAAHIEQLQRGEIASYSREKRFVRKDGRIIWAEISLSAVRGPDGRPTHIISVIRDISARKQTEERLRKVDRARNVMAECSRAMVHAEDELQLLQEMCAIAVKSGGYRMAWVGYAEHDEFRSVRAVARAGFVEGYLDVSRFSWSDNERGRGPAGRAIRSGQACVVRNILIDPDFAPWRESAVERGYRALIALPLVRDGASIGVLNLYTAEVDGFDTEEVALLEQLVADLAYGIVNLRARLEHARAEASLRANEELMRHTFEQAAVGIVYTTLDRRYLMVNQKFCDIVGYSRDELLAMSPTEVTHPDDRVDESSLREQLLSGTAKTYAGEKRYVRKDGTVIWVNRTVSLVRDNAGKPVHFIRVVDDISERKEAEGRFLATFEQAAVGIAHIDPGSFKIVLANRKFCELLGFANDELIGTDSRSRTPPGELPEREAERSQLVAGKIKSSSCERRLLRKDGSTLWVNRSLSLVRNAGGQPKYYISVIEDITERKQAEGRLAYLAQYDSLTGLPNRNLFRDRLAFAMARAKRSEQMVAVMFLGLDHFKVINDTLGYSTGDEVLKATAALLTDSLRDVDTVARVGADQFTVILENINHVDQITTVAEKIKLAFSAPLVIGEREVYVTASIGITIFPLSGDEIDALLQMADAAMYHAKKMGRNNYEFYAPELNARTGERLRMETLLRRALERREFVLHYQPKVEAATGKVVGVEALIRWNSKELGFIPPVQFIPLAEETGLIEPIGEWVIKTACAQSKAWQDQGSPPLLMSVNLSPRQLRQKNLVAMIAAMLAESGLAAHLLELELTESMIMENIEENIKTLKAIRGLGVNLAIDDFGTGYSSLGYLAKLPVQTLKIDRSFIMKMQDDSDAMTLVSTILTLARSLGLKVVAEGVETEEQAKVLRLLRCDQLQGFLISKPVPSAELSAFLSQSRHPITGPGKPTNRAGAATGLQPSKVE